MKKFLLGLLLGVSTTAAMAAPWAIPMYECKLPDGTRLGLIATVKEGLLVKISDKAIILTWDELSKAKAVAEAIPAE